MEDGDYAGRFRFNNSAAARVQEESRQGEGAS